MSLKEYIKKRDFKKTSEPGNKKFNGAGLIFVIHKHQASRLHYDLRLEQGGVLKSWALPKGIPVDPKGKHLAVQVEDHPYGYKDFEGVIPEGNYGAGVVMVWDEGTYDLTDGGQNKEEKEKIIKDNLKKGRLRFILNGKKVKGEFMLIRLYAGRENKWLLIKANDKYAYKKIINENISARSGKSMEEIKSGKGHSESTINELIKKWGEEKEMPKNIKPMLAFAIDAPFDNQDWLFEIKWDGYRAIAEVKKGAVRLYSRNLKLFNEKFPQIHKSLKGLDFKAVFDGEITVVDERGVSNFQALQNYPFGPVQSGNLVYYLFDILYYGKYDLQRLPLYRRKKILKEILPEVENIKNSGYVMAQGLKFADVARNSGVEGIMAKNIFSRYEQGIRDKNWLKIKFLHQEEAIICGFTEPVGGRKIFGSLVLGIYKNGEISYIGNVGTGFNESILIKIKEKLEPLIISTPSFKIPFDIGNTIWVKPKLVCEVKFSEWTRDGRIRQPVFLGLREDKEAGEVKEEERPDFRKSERSGKQRDSSKINIDGQKLFLTNLNKVYWPKQGCTKLDLINYYREISPYILPYIKNRPQSLHRHPNGITGESFYQKNVKGLVPDWIKTVEIFSKSRNEKITYMLCQDEKTLIYLANLGCIELHIWNSRVPSDRAVYGQVIEEKRFNKPDYFVFDLDPVETSFSNVAQAALVIHRILENLKIKNFCKTSGASGLHIYVPLGAAYTYEQTQKFGKIINILAFKKLPAIISLERSPEKRKGKVYLDI